MNYLPSYFFVGIATLCFTLLACFGAKVLFPRLGLMDNPQKYGLKRKPIPYFGGLIVWFVFLVSVSLFAHIDTKVFGIMFSVTVLTFVNFFDDKYGLNPWLRILVQIFCILIVIFYGVGISHITNPFGGLIPLDLYTFLFSINDTNYSITLLADIFTVIWMLLMINSMNWLDGVNGLVSGVSSLGGFIIFCLSITPMVNQPQIATLGLIVGCIALGFWFFDVYPARMLLGDTGSMFFGFILGILAIMSGGKIATAFLVMGFPILDAVFVIVRRMKKGQSPFKGDYTHFHHRLMESGLKHRQVLAVIYLLCGSFGISALFLQTWGKFIAIMLMFIAMLVMGALVKEEGKERD